MMKLKQFEQLRTGKLKIFTTTSVTATTTLLSIILTMALVLGSVAPAVACTQVYFGADTTDSGAYYYGRSEDISNSYSKLRKVVPAADHEPGTQYESSTGFKWPYPEHSLRYTITPDSYYNEHISPEPYGEVGMNEAGVAVEGTVTLGRAKDEITAPGTGDPQVSSRNGGWAETDLATVLLMNAHTAREAIQLAKEIIETVGAAGREGFQVSDAKEVWYMEMLSGHNAVAIKLPKDKVGFSPNRTMIGAVDLSDTQNVIATRNFLELPTRVGTLVTDAFGNIISNQSYASSTNATTGRTYLGYYYLQGVSAAKSLDNQPQQLLLDPRRDNPYSLMDAQRFLAFHGDENDALDGKYLSYTNGNGNAIGNRGTVEAHITEVHDTYPPAVAQIEWMAMASAEFSIYVPSYGNLVTDVYHGYYDADSDKSARDYGSIYWVARGLQDFGDGTSATDNVNARANVAPALSALLKSWQTKLNLQSDTVEQGMIALALHDPSKLETVATALYVNIGEETYDFMKQAYDEIKDWKDNGSTDVWLPSPSLAALSPHYSLDVLTGDAGQAIADLPFVDLLGISPTSDDDLSLYVGASTSIPVTFTPIDASNKGLQWSSADPSIASVDGVGQVTANKAGTTTITVKADYWPDGASYTFAKTVIVKQPVTSLKLSATTLALTVGSASTVSATVLPGSAQNKSIFWKTSNPSVATVIDGVVTAVGKGSATISAVAADGSDVVDSVTVTVTQPGTGVVIAPVDSALKPGEALQLTASVAPEDTTKVDLIWSSSNKEVATVDGDGLVTARAAGTTVITAKLSDGSGATTSVTLTVEKPAEVLVVKPTLVSGVKLDKKTVVLNKAKSVTLIAKVVPVDATNAGVTWKSSQPTIATVDTTGKVTGLKLGTAIIVAIAKDGSSIAAFTTVKVVHPVTSLKAAVKTVYVQKGGVYQLTPVAYTSDSLKAPLSYKSSNKKVATVSAGGTVTVRKASGTANIVVKAANGKSYTYIIKAVKSKKATKGFKLSGAPKTLKVGTTKVVKATPKTKKATNIKPSFKSSNSRVLKVDAAGTLTAIKAGKATVTVKVSGFAKTVTITVKK
ncbi:MAG: Ig-like domain-containing protein [Actinomycetes bacterium]|jgi:uncharacterized protein YjdB/dipeptidase|nr:Ig-like domain-containing protein [Actinomycetes bacterium]